MVLCHLLIKKEGLWPPSFLVGLQGLEPWTLPTKGRDALPRASFGKLVGLQGLEPWTR